MPFWVCEPVPSRISQLLLNLLTHPSIGSSIISQSSMCVPGVVPDQCLLRSSPSKQFPRIRSTNSRALDTHPSYPILPSTCGRQQLASDCNVPSRSPPSMLVQARRDSSPSHQKSASSHQRTILLTFHTCQGEYPRHQIA